MALLKNIYSILTVPDNFTLLLAWDAASVEHTNYTKTLQVFLQQNLRIKVLLDIIEVPASSDCSPYKWYAKMLEEADCVAFIVPPKVTQGTQRGSPYQNTYQFCLNFLENVKLTNENPAAIDSCIVLFLPDSESTLLPNQLNFLAKFKMPSQHLFLRQHIQWISTRDLGKFYRCIKLPSCLLPNSKSLSSSFFNLYNQISNVEVKTPLLSSMPEEEINLVIENEFIIQQKTEQLDIDFGKGILGVRMLPTIEQC